MALRSIVVLTALSALIGNLSTPAAAKTLIDPETQCALTVDFDGVTSTGIRWSGTCADGAIEGDGTLDWYNGSTLVWRTRIASDTPHKITDGRLDWNFDLTDFDVFCKAQGGNYRGTFVIPKQPIPEDFFSGYWVTMRVLSWAGEYAATQCPAPAGYSNINIEILPVPTPRESLAQGFRSIVHARNFPNDRLDWFAPRSEYGNIPHGNLWRAIELENEQVEAKRREDAHKERKKLLQQQLNEAMVAVQNRVQTFWASKSGTLDIVATALEADLAKTLAVLEDGVSVSGFNNQNISNLEHNGRSYYAVSGFAQSEFLKVQQQFESNSGFSWSGFLDQSSGSGFKVTQFMCLFRNVGDIPSAGASTNARLERYTPNSVKPVVLLICD